MFQRMQSWIPPWGTRSLRKFEAFVKNHDCRSVTVSTLVAVPVNSDGEGDVFLVAKTRTPEGKKASYKYKTSLHGLNARAQALGRLLRRRVSSHITVAVA